MSNRPNSPRWYGIPWRVLLATVLGTLICFAISLLIGILGTVVVSVIRGVHPDMRVAYRLVALPIGIAAGTIIFVVALVMEIRHYRQARVLSSIENSGSRAAPRIAIPLPHSTDHKYGKRAISQYERAVVLAGGEPVRIPLDRSAEEVTSLMAACDGVLLPGSNADVDPVRFDQQKSPHSAAADLRREEVDDLLLEHAYRSRKPVLGICYGLQSLNVFRKGSLIQHIPDSLPEATRAKVNHEAGRKVAVAHQVEIVPSSLLAAVVAANGTTHLPVNSSHHQSADGIGEGLQVAARCTDDGIIEAVEGTDADHFVLAVQWHPERSVDDDDSSQRIFRALVEAANSRKSTPGSATHS